jgi:zinc transport system permease protein
MREVMESWVAEAVEFVRSHSPDGTMLSFEYNVRGLVALVFISVICGSVGSLVVGSRMAFFSDALAHTAFAGIALGILIAYLRNLSGEDLYSWVTPVMIAVGLVVGLAIVFVREQTGQSSDTIIGVFFAGAIGIGAIMLKVGNAKFYFPPHDFLFGNLVTAKEGDLLALAGLMLATLGMLAWAYNGLVFATFNSSLARSRRVPFRLYQYVFVALLAVIVNVCLSAVGALLINALLVVPAATAANLCRNLRQMFRWSVGLCLVCCVVGQWMNWEIRIPVGGGRSTPMGEGGTIVVLSVLLFFVSMAIGPWLKRRAVRPVAS